jgi:hypothetical protein
MALLLNGDARDETCLARSAFVTQELRKVVGNNGVLVSKACSSGQFGRCWLVFR